MRKGLDGSDYVFTANQSVEMEVFMTAPSSMQSSEYAYNRPAYNATFRATNVQEGTTSFNISDRTTIALHDLQEFRFIKQYKTDDGSSAPLSGVTFQLYKCTNEDANHTHTGIPGQADSCWGKTPVQTVNSKTDGEVKFSELDTGAYAIYESASKNGFNRIVNQYWLVDVDAREGTIGAPVAIRTGSSTYPLVEMQWNEETDEMQGYYSLLNERPIRNIDAVKTWYEDSAKLIRPSKLTFDLYRNDELYATKEVTVSTTSNSQTFKNLFTGLFVYDENGTAYTYKVVERIPDGYTEDKNGEVTLPLTIGTSRASFTNRRLGVLDVSKVVSGKITDEEFSFTVTLTDGEGGAIDTTDAEGNPVTFTGRKFTTDDSSYTEETLTLTEGGKLTFRLKDGETMRIIGLPIGVNWSASEDTATQYNTTVSPNSASGTTSQTATGKVIFTNTLKTGSLTVRKTIAGNDIDKDKDKAFAFTVTLDDNSISGTYSGIEFAEGKATFTLKGGESKLIEGLPSGTGYTVTEADYTADGYVTAKTGDTGKIDEMTPAEAVFTNTRDTYGKLTVTKAVAGNAASADKEFNFTVTLGDTSINGTYGDMVFTDGVANFMLKGGESKSADNLPNGTTYTVTESDYTSDGYVTTKTDDTGTVVGNETVTVKFTNTRNADGSLTVSKTIKGNAADTDKEFTFTVTLDDTAISGTYSGVEFTDGKASFTLKGGESKVIEGLPNGTGYSVEEADYTSEGYVTTKTGEIGKIDENTPTVAAFTNTKDTFGELIVTKTVAGNAPSADKEFNFTVTLGDTSINGTYGDMVFTDGVANFMLKGGESKIAENLPNGTTYTVTESDYTSDGYVTTKTDDTGTVVGNETVTAKFTNTRNADGSLTVSKTIKGNAADTDKEFTFTVTLDDTAISGTYSGVEFTDGKASFTLKGGESKVIEGLPNGTGYSVEEADYTSEGYVTTKTGEIGKIDENTPTVAAFTNTKDTFGELIVTKTVAGNAPSADKEFDFTVTLGNTSINGTYGDMVFTDGVSSFTLKGGESKSVDNLPNGTTYTVTEADYTSDGYVTTKTGDIGTIVGNDTVTAAFTNTRDTDSPLTPSNPTTPAKKIDQATDQTDKVPPTGDKSNMNLWLIPMLGACVLMLACVYGIKRRNGRRHDDRSENK